MKLQLILWGLILGFIISPSYAQDKTSNKFGKGVKIEAQDSSFSVRFGARIQSLYVGVLNTETGNYADKFLIRRARLKFDGYAYSTKLTYKFELGFSNSDMKGGNISQASNTANVILDAVIKYNFYKNWTVWVGQAKLPGNLERTISSGSLQFVDRSNLNSKYNIDRDAGIQLHYNTKKFRAISSISSGEGRNVTAGNVGGYDYTQRVEWLPYGSFKDKGDFSGSDLKRESSPRLMIGATYDFNDHASRESGQLGSFLTEQRSLKTWFIDAHFKYNGFSAMGEYADKKATGGSTIVDDNGSYVESFYVGKGYNAQAGYLFRNNFEIAARYTSVIPQKETQNNENTQYTIGLSKYIVGHSLKVQTDATLIQEETKSDAVMFRFQVEFSL